MLFNSVKIRRFEENFSSYETDQSVGGANTKAPQDNKHLTYPQAELGLSPCIPCWVRTHDRHSGENIAWFQEIIIVGDVKRYKQAKIRKRRNQKEIPNPKTEVGEN